MNVRAYRRIGSGVLVAALALPVGGCGKQVRTGRSPAYLIINSITASSGAEPTVVGSTLHSDVVTNVPVEDALGNETRVPTVFNDLGQVEIRMALKDIGQPGNPAAPTENNTITITRYHVDYRRTDGRNTPGVDVPYGFDGATTASVSAITASRFGFELVRIQAKKEPPLSSLGDSLAISTIADVTFYGRDQAGNDVSVTGSISVDFADWADPE